MNEIQRYALEPTYTQSMATMVPRVAIIPHPEGQVVLYTDHIAALARASSPDPAREALVGAFSCAEIDEICCEFSAPEYVATDDGEAWYWRFPGHELPVADDLGELLLAARMLLKRRALAEQGHKGEK